MRMIEKVKAKAREKVMRIVLPEATNRALLKQRA
jgi:hypothetical protein